MHLYQVKSQDILLPPVVMIIYGGVGQPWLVIESEARKESEFKQLEKQTSNQKIYPGTIPTTKNVSTGICMWRRCIQPSQIT